MSVSHGAGLSLIGTCVSLGPGAEWAQPDWELGRCSKAVEWAVELFAR